MPSLPNPIKIATKGAELGFQVGTFVAGQAFQRAQSLLGRDGDDQARYAPTTPPPLESVSATRTAPSAPVAPPKEITAKPSTGATKGETTTTVKATPRTGPRSSGGRISNPKAARKVRARSAGAASKADLSKAKGKGGRPATVKAANSPAEPAESKQGK